MMFNIHAFAHCYSGSKSVQFERGATTTILRDSSAAFGDERIHRMIFLLIFAMSASDENLAGSRVVELATSTLFNLARCVQYAHKSQRCASQIHGRIALGSRDW